MAWFHGCSSQRGKLKSKLTILSPPSPATEALPALAAPESSPRPPPRATTSTSSHHFYGMRARLDSVCPSPLPSVASTSRPLRSAWSGSELELELIQSHMAQKPVLRHLASVVAKDVVSRPRSSGSIVGGHKPFARSFVPIPKVIAHIASTANTSTRSL